MELPDPFSAVQVLPLLSETATDGAGCVPRHAPIHMMRQLAPVVLMADVVAEELPKAAADDVTSEIAIGSKLGIDATKKLPGEGFKRPWPPLIKMDESVKAKVEKLLA